MTIRSKALIGDRRRSLALVGIVVLGGALRLLCAFWVPNDYAGGTTFPDSYNYASIASNLATKSEFSNSYMGPDCYQCLGSIGPTSFREPAYPLFLAIQFRVFGDSPRTTFVIQALLGTLIIPLCFVVTTLFFPRRVGLMAALLESINPYHIRYVGIVATETLSSLVLMLVVLISLKGLEAINRNGEMPRSVAGGIGLSLALAVLVRSTLAAVALVTLAFLAAALLRQPSPVKTGLRTMGIIVVVLGAGVSPWFIRNFLLWDTIVYHTASGEVLVEGFNDRATGGFGGFTRALDRQLRPFGYDEVERDRIFRRTAYEWIRAHPGKALRLMGMKQVLFWSPVPATVTGGQRLVGALWGSAFLALAAMGLITVRKDRRAIQYVITVILTYAIFHSLAIAVTRYRLPLEALLTIPAAYGVALVIRTRRRPGHSVLCERGT